ncbi:type II secretion system protein I [Stutzerimonas nosocomialis]|uniref:Type II secretion system protein I n=1 Tax=Stutzerimonas nosocomialis TaxID=1056496 RepID=A0A5R9QG25_9GAMM|nr:prepilin-type N-terminal cleavage/methylation domain-containing protein [Stutzerimonas nosocomialis]TLX54570.1 type II secretion system protein I [Stutzerimonas nosocomialis]TLX61337.1 type II secretion system protein I [Stutzerimonas nosocomialis]TLX64139.1 type II secretion system protein I [Stutzerimonas nosocomialis]
MNRSAGFTLLEVMVALLIAATLAVMVGGVLRQRIDGHLAVRDHQYGALCARELLARFEVEQYWPMRDEVGGELRQGPGLCLWQLTLGYTGVANLRRGELMLRAEDGRPLGQYSLFLQRP